MPDASGGNEREVVIRLSVAVDPKAAKAFQDTAKAAIKTQNTVAKATKKAADDGAKAVADAASKEAKIRETGRKFHARQEAKAAKEQAVEIAANIRNEAKLRAAFRRDRARGDREAQRDRTRNEKEAQRNREQMLREESREIEANIREREKLAKDAERAIARERRVNSIEFRNAQTRVATENRKLVASFRGVAAGVANVARGVAILGIVGEKDIEKLARSLLKVQAGVDVFRGSIQTVLALVRAWKAYQAAVAAAAVTQGVLAAAQAATVAGGAAGGAARGVGGGVGGAIAGGAIAGGAAGSGALAAAGTPVALGLGVLAQVTLPFAVASEATGFTNVIPDLPTSLKEFNARRLEGAGSLFNTLDPTGRFTTGAGDIEDSRRRNRDRAALPAKRRAFEAANQKAFRQAEFNRAGRARNITTLGGAQAEVERARGLQGGGSIERQQSRDLDLHQALQQRLRIRKEIQTTAQETNRDDLAAANKSLSILQRQLTAKQSERDAAVNASRSATQRFGALSAFDQANAKAAARRVRAGTSSRQDEILAQGLGLEAGNERLGERGVRGGSAEFFGDQFRIGELDRGVRNAQTAVNRQDELLITVRTEGAATVEGGEAGEAANKRDAQEIGELFNKIAQRNHDANEDQIQIAREAAQQEAGNP